VTDARLRAAQASLEGGDYARAASVAGEVADDPRAPPPMRALALRLRADARGRMGDGAGALADLRRAVDLLPGDARAWNALGIAAADAGEPDAAADAFARATQLDPQYARAWNNLGNALRTLSRLDEALAAFGRAVEVDPRYAHAWANLAVARRDAGDEDGAIEAANRSLGLDPGQRTARLVIAGIDRRGGRLDAAASAYALALAERPDDAVARVALAGTLAERDDLEAARSAFAQAARSDPRMLRARLGAELLLPMIPASRAAIAEARERFASSVARLAVELPPLASAMPRARVLHEVARTNFLLAYHGEDDRALQSAYGDLVAAMLGAAQGAPIGGVAPRRERPARTRVAFVSAFFREGTVGRYFASWITGLDPERFEVIVHRLGDGNDEVTASLRGAASGFVSHGVRAPAEVARVIAEGAPDVVVYPELGMDSTSFALASLRLAPLQCAGWGHPVTCGLPTIDVAFSVDAMEPPGGEAHYRERLVRLPGLGTRYSRPAAPERVARESLGLPSDGTLFLVPQSLFKMHPDDDDRVARVLAEVPGSRIVAFQGRHPKLTAEWHARLAPVLDAHGVEASRILVLPHVGHDDYLRINLACDAMLDNARWTGGNTSLDAIACGLPIVTRPGAFMRGRQSAGMLALIGADALVASDEDGLVAIARRLAEDAAWRAEVSALLREGSYRLFDDAAPLAALADALERG